MKHFRWFFFCLVVAEHQASIWCVRRKRRKNKNDLIFRRLMMEYKILRVCATRNYGYIKIYNRKGNGDCGMWTRFSVSVSGCRFYVSFCLILDLFPGFFFYWPILICNTITMDRSKTTHRIRDLIQALYLEFIVNVESHQCFAFHHRNPSKYINSIKKSLIFTSKHIVNDEP